MSELNSSTLLSTPPPYTKKKHVGIGDSPSSSKLRFLKFWVILAPPSFISADTGSCPFHSWSLLYPSSVRSVINGHLVSFNKKIQQKLFLRYFSVLYSLSLSSSVLSLRLSVIFSKIKYHILSLKTLKGSTVLKSSDSGLDTMSWNPRATIC